MGNIYKRGKVWYIDITVKGRRIRKRITKSKRLAELALKDVEVKAAKEEFGFAQNDISLDKFIELFMEYSRTNHRPNSTDRYRAVIDHFRRFLESFPNITFISEITTELIERYKIYRKGSRINGNGSPVKDENNITAKTRRRARAHTINFEINTLRLMFNLAIDWGYLKANPTKNVKKLKVDDSKPVRFLTKDECQRFLNATPVHLYPIYFTFINTGLRKSELENLQWIDIDFKRRKIVIRHKEEWRPKSGEREIPINDALYKVLKELRDGCLDKDVREYVFDVKNSGRSHNLLRNELIKIAKRTDIENLTKVHTLRHTFASHLVMQGVDLPTIQKLMGHSDIETTMVYAHLIPDHLTSAVNKLQF